MIEIVARIVSSLHVPQFRLTLATSEYPSAVVSRPLWGSPGIDRAPPGRVAPGRRGVYGPLSSSRPIRRPVYKGCGSSPTQTWCSPGRNARLFGATKDLSYMDTIILIFQRDSPRSPRLLAYASSHLSYVWKRGVPLLGNLGDGLLLFLFRVFNCLP